MLNVQHSMFACCETFSFDSAWHRDCNMSKLHYESVSDVMVEFCIFNSFMWKSSCNVNRCRKNWNCLFSNVFGMLTFAAVENSIRISFLNSFFFSSKKGLNKDKNSIGHLWLLCLVSRSLCELRECKRVTSSWAEIFMTVLRCFRLLPPAPERN